MHLYHLANQFQAIFFTGGGTAKFIKNSNDQINQINTEKLTNIIKKDTCFVKIDTDGFDVKIIHDNLDFFKKNKTSIIFENQISTQEDLQIVNSLFERLIANNYKFFIFWDDPGYHIVSTSSLNIIRNLNQYLLKVSNYKGPRNLYGYDVLCLQSNEEDIYNSISEFYKSY